MEIIRDDLDFGFKATFLFISGTPFASENGMIARCDWAKANTYNRTKMRKRARDFVFGSFAVRLGRRELLNLNGISVIGSTHTHVVLNARRAVFARGIRV